MCNLCLLSKNKSVPPVVQRLLQVMPSATIVVHQFTVVTQHTCLQYGAVPWNQSILRDRRHSVQVHPAHCQHHNQRMEGSSSASAYHYGVLRPVAPSFCSSRWHTESLCAPCQTVSALDCGNQAVLPGRCHHDNTPARSTATELSCCTDYL